MKFCARIFILGLLINTIFASCSHIFPEFNPADHTDSIAWFSADILPILTTSCNVQSNPVNFPLANYSDVLSFAGIKPRHLESSRFYDVVESG